MSRVGRRGGWGHPLSGLDGRILDGLGALNASEMLQGAAFDADEWNADDCVTGFLPEPLGAWAVHLDDRAGGLSGELFHFHFHMGVCLFQNAASVCLSARSELACVYWKMPTGSRGEKKSNHGLSNRPAHAGGRWFAQKGGAAARGHRQQPRGKHNNIALQN